MITMIPRFNIERRICGRPGCGKEYLPHTDRDKYCCLGCLDRARLDREALKAKNKKRKDVRSSH